MRALLLASAFLLGLCAPAASGAALSDVIDSLFPRPDLRVVTVTDVTPTGTLWRPASPANPIYYAAGSVGYRDLGASIAGERQISEKEVIATIVKVLAKQGYLPATAAHPPTVLLMWTWGTMNAEYVTLYYGGSSMLGRQLNERQLLRFLGGEKLGLGGPTNPFMDDLAPGLIPLSDAAEEIREAARDHLYVASVAAYDYEAARNRKPVLLWNTRISAPARGFWLPEILPSMLVIAGPMLGRETSKPVWIDATDRFRPEVILGDPRVVEYADRAEEIIVEAAPAAGEKTRSEFRRE